MTNPIRVVASMRIRGLAAIAAATLGIGALGVPSAAAQAPYEPNDSFNTAFGPIEAGTSYSAGLETRNDIDEYFFYLPNLTQLRYQLTVPAANGSDSSIELYVYRQLADSVDEQAYLRVSDGETGTGAVTLERGKYYVHLEPGCCPSDPTGDTYSFKLDPPGVTSTYEPFAAECAAANPRTAAAAERLERLKAKLRKAKAEDAPRAKIERLKGKKRAAQAEFKAASAAEADACSVPQ